MWSGVFYRSLERSASSTAVNFTDSDRTVIQENTIVLISSIDLLISLRGDSGLGSSEELHRAHIFSRRGNFNFGGKSRIQEAHYRNLEL